MKTPLTIALALCALFGPLGCQFLGGAAVGAGATGAAYEIQNKRALDELERDYAAGGISREDYLERKHDIEKRSVIR